MKNLLNYRSNKDNKAGKIAQDLIDFIEDFVRDDSFASLIKGFSNITNIPEKVLSYETKQILSNNFNFTKCKFKNYFSIFKIIKDLIIYFCFSLWIFLFTKKSYQKKKYDILIDDVEQENSVWRFKKLITLFNKSILISNNRLNKKSFKNYKCDYIPFSKFMFYDREYLKNKKVKIFNFLFVLFSNSIKYKINLFFIFNLLLFKIIKYETLFNKYSAKFLIIERFYKTSAIRNYLFHKHGGALTSCIQKNITEFSISFFVNTDVMLTLGKNTAESIKMLGGLVKKFEPVGDLSMEQMWFNEKKDLKNVPDIDIMIAGTNIVNDTDRHIDPNHHKNYYETIYWLKKFSGEYPNIKIYLKHHESYPGDKKEEKMLEKSNVKIIIRSSSSNKSYAFMEKSKIVCSFVSTMVLESIGNGKVGYYLDPNLQNDSFFNGLDQANPIRINSYKDFKNKMLNNLKNKNYEIKDDNRDLFCLKSDKVSERIYNFLNSL